MYIKFTNIIEDYANFQLFHNENSPSIRMMNFSARIISSAIFVVLAVVWYLQGEFNLAPFALVAAVIVYFYTSHSIKKKTGKLAKKMCKEGENKGFLCEHTLEVGEKFLIEKTDQGEQTCLFSCIERICLTDGYAFIYVGSTHAHVVPITRISEGDVDEFINELQLKCNL